MAMRFVFGRVDRFKALLATVAVAATMIGAASTPADARHRHKGGYHRASHHTVHHVRGARHRHTARAQRAAGGHATGGFLRPTYASIVVDANTGRTLSAQNESAPHHPASITKVMTLYLLFEELEKGKIRLDSDITVSQRAAAQQPTKLGLRPGSTIDVEDAIKAVVTRSANDIAVAIAENIGGDESTFAEMMTRKARSLGMYGTTFRNASGLPNPGQITTARDLSILGRAIQDRFPRYYKYFATRTFYFRGKPIGNHNHLLGRVEGVDGIKTGYTAASGFNLLSSVRRDGRYIVSVVLGGKTYAQRDRIMAGLIEDNLGDASTRRTAVAVAERGEDTDRQSARVMESAPDDAVVRKVARVETRAPVQLAAAVAPVAAVEPPSEPRRINTASLDLAVPLPPAKIEARVERARPAVVTAVRAEPEAAEPATRAARRAALEGATARPLAYAATSTPSNLRWVEGPQGRVNARAEALRPEARVPEARTEAKAEGKSSEPKSSEAKSTTAKIPLVRPGNTGWMIQIGATEDAEKAHELLARAKGKASLASAKPFTEKVQKGSGTLWRARFAGLEEDSAEAACKSLKRSGFSCFATRN